MTALVPGQWTGWGLDNLYLPRGLLTGNILQGNAINKAASVSIPAAMNAAGLVTYTVCTSGTHPALPSVGDKLFETDTGKELTYQSVTTGWTPEWNTAWGQAAIAGWAADSTNTSATFADVTGAAVTWTTVANRRYRYSVSMLQEGSLAGIIAEWQFTDGGGTQKGDGKLFRSVTFSTASVFQPVTLITTESGIAAGSVTRKVQHSNNSAAGTLHSYADGTHVGVFIVEDVGPSAAPA